MGALPGRRRPPVWPIAARPFNPSIGKAEMHHVAILDDVILALEAELAGLARAGLALARDIVVVGDGLGTDEALLEIGVDDARRLRRAGAHRNRPGARLL